MVLLILAGVSINLVLGENGIVKKSQDAKSATREKQLEEQVQLAIGDSYTEGEGNIKDAELKKALNNHLGEDNYDITGDETNGWKITVKETNKTYNVDASGNKDTGLNWGEIMKDATEHPNNYRHPEQSETNKDIGIGTDGKAVNMDLWNVRIVNEQAWLNVHVSCFGSMHGYIGKIIDGMIEGKVPQYVKKDGYDSFYEVTNIDGMLKYSEIKIAPDIPSGVTSMDATFEGCDGLVTVPPIPNGVTNMNNTFLDCKSLKSVPNIPKSVTSMSKTFFRCESLESPPILPDGITELDRTFMQCMDLTKAPKIPESVTSLTGTFAECYRLEEAPAIPENVISMSATFQGCPGLKEAPIIPSKVKKMGYTFKDCTNLENAPTIPENVTYMDNTFAGCTGLTVAPSIPDKVTYMRETFSGCTGLLTAPKIPNSVTCMIGTFSGCTNLVIAPDIPNSVTSVANAFSRCSSLTGKIVVNAASLDYITDCFKDTVKPITLTGTSSKLADLAATATNGNVTVGQ